MALFLGSSKRTLTSYFPTAAVTRSSFPLLLPVAGCKVFLVTEVLFLIVIVMACSGAVGGVFWLTVNL